MISIEKFVDGQSQGRNAGSVDNLLSADEERSFYVSWSNDNIFVGPTREFADRYIDADYGVEIVVVELKLYTLDTIGSWTLNNNQGERSRDVMSV